MSVSTATEMTPKQAQRLDAVFAEAERLAALPAEARRVYRALSVLRARLAREVGIPAYRVLANATLLALTEARPASAEALRAVPGINPLILKVYGPELLEAARS